MKKIIFICKGNMHRSVIAETLYNLFKKDDSFAKSYGTMVEAEGRKGIKISSYPEFTPLINYLKNNYGTDISDHACRQVTPEVLKDADKIIVLTEEEFIPDWLRKYNYEKWEVKDLDDFSTQEVVAQDVKNIMLKVNSLL